MPTKVPTAGPTKIPTKVPTAGPTKIPTKVPTAGPTKIPTKVPTAGPTKIPTKVPTAGPTKIPTKNPTNADSFDDDYLSGDTPVPSNMPSELPTKHPTDLPSQTPSVVDTDLNVVAGLETKIFKTVSGTVVTQENFGDYIFLATLVPIAYVPNTLIATNAWKRLNRFEKMSKLKLFNSKITSSDYP